VERSVRSGVEDAELGFLTAHASSTAGCFCTFLSLYMLFYIDQLSWLSTANAVFSLLLHIKSLGDELMRCNLGDLQYQYGKAVVKKQEQGSHSILALMLWAYCTMGCQIIITSIFARIWHPVLAILLFLPVAASNAALNVGIQVADGSGYSFCFLFLTGILEPNHLLAPQQSSVFGLHQYDPVAGANLGNQPAWQHCATQALRFVVMGMLMCVDVHNAPLGPMGQRVFKSEFIIPYNDFSAADGNQDITAASVTFRRFCLFLVAGMLPVCVVGTSWLLATNACFRDGQPDDAACQEMDNMKAAVESDDQEQLKS